MDYRNLPSNSHKSKEEQQTRQKKEKVATGKVTLKKKSLLRRVFSGLIEDDAKSIGDYIIEDVLQPTLKKTCLSIITGSAERIFGVSARSSNQQFLKKSNASYTSYSSVSKSNNEPKVRSSSRYDFDDIIFENRGDAEDVKDAITALIEGQYKVATVADLYDLIGIEETEFTDNNYGWTNPKNFSVSFTNGGYRLNVPNPIPLR